MSQRTKNPPTVIIIDRDAALLGALKFALEVEGYGVATYRSGGEVLAARLAPGAGCLIIDATLPDMTGVELLAALRSRGIALPAILTSGRVSPAQQASAAEAGLRIVEKPLMGDALLDAIRSVLAPAADPV
jgi:FixJ family two-component response regulator